VHHSLNKCSALRAAIEKEVNQPNRNKLVLLTKAKVCAHISSGSGEARLLVVVR